MCTRVATARSLRPEREHFDKPAAMMAYSRTMTLLREVLGPVYGLNQL
jgi:carboxymethylenebutenolidase